MAQTKLRLRNIMQQDVQTVRRNDELLLADQLMKQARIRHLPVLDEYERVCAVVSQRDLFRGALLRALGYGGRAEETMLRQIAIKEAMSSELYTAPPEMTVAEAAQLMIEKKIGCLPVVEGDKLVGIVTETDFVKLAC